VIKIVVGGLISCSLRDETIFRSILVPRISPSKLIATVAGLLLLGAAVNAQDIRQGHDAPTVAESIEVGKITEWTMASGIEGGALGDHDVTSEVYDSGDRIFFTTIVEFILDEPDRRPFYDRLFKRGYYTNVTERGVSYQIDEVTDRNLRLLSQEDVRLTRYVPHDCKRVLGRCAYEKQVGDRVLHLLRTSSFDGGVWRDTVAYDPSRDPKGRDDLLEESTFSVDAAGVLIDEETRRHSRLGTSLTRMARIDFGKPDPATPGLPPELVLPEGAYFSLSVTCSLPGRAVDIEGERRVMAEEDRWIRANRSDATAAVDCGSTNQMEGLCHQQGHVIVLANAGRVGFACFEGPPPGG